MRQPIRHPTIVCQQDETFRIRVQAPHGEQTSVVGHQVNNSRTTERVGGGREHPARLVEQDVLVCAHRADGLSIHFDGVGIGIHFDAQLAHHAAIDAHTTRADEFLGLSSRGNARSSNDLLQPHFLAHESPSV